MFLIRAAFWLSIVVLFIPAGPQTDRAEIQRVSAGEAMVAAHAVWSDLSAFCIRNPTVCDTGGKAIDTFAQKAKNGARMVYDYLDADDAVVNETLADEAMDAHLEADDGEGATTLYQTGVAS
ncbi:MAG: DUF5330 domain-containing protein [Pseudomonadota bacterium]